MASGKTDYLENELLDHALRNATWTPPATVYLALYTTAPGEATAGTEVSGGSYARQAVTCGAASGGQVQNSGLITFPTASAGWGTITGAALVDTSSGACNILYYLDGLSQVVNTNDIVSVAIAALTVTEA